MKISAHFKSTSITLLLFWIANLHTEVNSSLTDETAVYYKEGTKTANNPGNIKFIKRDVWKMKLQFLDRSHIKFTREHISQCTEGSEFCDSAKEGKYRNMNGTCNNLEHPYWGRSLDCYRRILPYDYNGNNSLPKISCTGKELPNARLVSNVFHKETKEKSDGRTTHFMEWGQMVSHDITFNPLFVIEETGQLFNCCADGVLVNDICMSIPVPPGDSFYNQFGISCLNYGRTQSCPYCKSGKRSHLNLNTGFHDLSLVYGSDDETASGLRSKTGGMLKADNRCESGAMLPTVGQEELCESPPGEERCYHSGDLRTNQTPFLLTVHTYLLRHHNFICQELRKVNPHWNDETLYQEARRINIAQVQYITYGIYLPKVIGPMIHKEGIGILPGNEYTKYDARLDPGVIDEFAVFAARYGHTLIPGTLSEIDSVTHRNNKIKLRNYYYNPYKYPCQQFEKIAKGMTVDEENERDQLLSEDVRDFLYRRLYLNESYAFDLATLSVLRSRDHGIPGYTYYLAYFFNIYVQTFDDLKTLMPHESVEQLRTLYESVHDVEIYSAGLAEYSVFGGIIGPTFRAVLVDQYRRLKFGDRYWFEHGSQAGSFTPDQLMEIKQSSLARILCETTAMNKIQKDPFFPPSKRNPVVSCREIHRFNFQLWKE